MRKKLSFLLFAVVITSTSTAYAEDSFSADDSSPQGQIGLIWYEDVLRGGIGVSAVTAYNDAEQYVCESVAEPKCAKFRLRQVEVMLPACSSGQSDYCVEGMQVGKAEGSLSSGKYIRSIAGTTVPADAYYNIPVGGTTSIWQVPGELHSGGNDKYSVGAQLKYAISNGQVELISFQASIVPFRETTGPGYRFMETKVMDTYAGKQIVHDWHVGNCIWQEREVCAVATRWSEGAAAALTLRVPNRVTGWLHGRLEDPTISVTKMDTRVNRIVVSAKPVTVQGSAPKVNVADITPALMKVITRGGKEPLRKDSGYVWQLEPSSYNFDWFDAWLPFTKDKADGFSDYWNFKSIAGNFSSEAEQRCLYSSAKLVGLVTTNSLWYSGNPPSFKDSELNYKVAALHLNPDGITPFLGTYDLVLDSAAARCLYGYSAAPIQASLNIISANGENQVATTTLNENGGWLKLSAKGFTFSSPTIKVKFTQEGSIPAPTVPKASNATKKTSIFCKKGKLIRTVVGIKPACPAGYKKSEKS